MKTKNLSLKTGDSPRAAFIKNALKAGALAVLFTALLMCIAAIVIGRVDMPHTLFQPITTALLAAGAFLAARLTGKAGLGAGVVLFAALMILWAITGNGEAGPQLFIKLAACLCAGYLGSLSAQRHATQKTKLKM